MVLVTDRDRVVESLALYLPSDDLRDPVEIALDLWRSTQSQSLTGSSSKGRNSSLSQERVSFVQVYMYHIRPETRFLVPETSVVLRR